MSKSPPITATTLDNNNNISSNNENIEKKLINSPPSSIDIQYKLTPSTTPSPPISPSKKDISLITHVSSHNINNNNKGVKQKKPIKSQKDDNSKFFTIIKNFIISIYKTLSKIVELMSYFRLVLAFTLYVLIFIDIIYIYLKMEKEFWVEILTQAINLELTFLTIVGYPKRIRNLPRAIKIWWADRKGEIPTIKSYSSKYTEIQKVQMSVSKDYKWYIYDTLELSLNCTPIKLLLIILIWNIGSLAQYGISGILWSFSQTKRPEIPYIILTIIALMSEFVPVPIVVIQSRRARMSNNFEIRYSFEYSTHDAR